MASLLKTAPTYMKFWLIIQVKNSEEEASLKQLQRYGNRWIFHPLNPKYEDLDLKRGEFRIVGKVAEKQKKYG